VQFALNQEGAGELMGRTQQEGWKSCRAAIDRL